MTHPKRLVIVCGVRPHYVKCKGLLDALDDALRIDLIDARQHYDAHLTDLFIEEFNLPISRTIQHTSKDSHARAGRIYSEICHFLSELKGQDVHPVLLVIGDTATTLMSAVAGLRMGCSIIHYEAGVRAALIGNDSGSVENRIRSILGQMTNLNLCMLPSHVENLRNEGASGQSVWVGDLCRNMLLRNAKSIARPGDYILVHLHKTENREIDRLREVTDALLETQFPVRLLTDRPIHDLFVAASPPSLRVIGSGGYERLAKEVAGSRFVITDSGSVQREAFLMGKRCLVRRATFGWQELFQDGGHVLSNLGIASLVSDIRNLWANPAWMGDEAPMFDRKDGTAIAREVITEFVQGGGHRE